MSSGLMVAGLVSAAGVSMTSSGVNDGGEEGWVVECWIARNSQLVFVPTVGPQVDVGTVKSLVLSNFVV